MSGRRGARAPRRARCRTFHPPAFGEVGPQPVFELPVPTVLAGGRLVLAHRSHSCPGSRRSRSHCSSSTSRPGRHRGAGSAAVLGVLGVLASMFGSVTPCARHRVSHASLTGRGPPEWCLAPRPQRPAEAGRATGAAGERRRTAAARPDPAAHCVARGTGRHLAAGTLPTREGSRLTGSEQRLQAAYLRRLLAPGDPGLALPTRSAHGICTGSETGC